MTSSNKSIQLGLCCINTHLRAQKPPIFASRSIILKTFNEKGFEYLKEKIIQNLEDVLKIMDYNELIGIKVYRLSSGMFPHKSNPKAPTYDLEFARDILKKIGDKSRELNQRLTYHPGQYNVIGTPSEEAFKNTCLDLQYHADILDMMELDQHSVMVIHGGGKYGDKEATKIRWCKQFKTLSESIKKRLVLENCEKNFSIHDCLEISEIIHIPVVFDTHHFECYKLLHPDETFHPPEYYIPKILDTWHKRNIKPKFHVSEQGSGRCGHHSDFIETIPNYLLEIPEKYGIHIDIMIEAKMKEQAILKLYAKYPHLNCQVKSDNSLFDKGPTSQWITTHIKDCDCCTYNYKPKRKFKIVDEFTKC